MSFLQKPSQVLSGPAAFVMTVIATTAAPAEQSGDGMVSATQEHIVTYRCREGVPLTMRYEDAEDRSIAFVSYDGFPEVTLTQIVSGSGTRYASGPMEVHVKGRTAMFSFDGLEDVCEED